MVPAGRNTVALPPTPIFNGPDEAAEPEGAISETALHEKVVEAIPPSGPRGLQTLDDHLFLKWVRGRCLPPAAIYHSLIL